MNKHLLYFISLISLVLTSCNPNCDSIVIVEVTPSVTASTHEVLLSSPVPLDLKDTRILIGDRKVEDMRFVEDRGLIAKVPEGIEVSNEAAVRVQDLDCGHDIQVGGLNVSTADDLFNNGSLVFPSTPIFVIPTPPPSLPPSIDNAWVSPVNDDYCLWFVSKKEYTFDSNGVKIDSIDLPILDTENSREQSICTVTLNEEDCAMFGSKLYCRNRMSGIVDKERNFIDITIHRSENNPLLEDESFSGQLIDIDNPQFPVNRNTFHNGCLTERMPDFSLIGHLMLLTSKTTGRQLLVAQPCIGIEKDSPECD